MPFISEDKIEEIRSRAGIVSVISHYVNLKKTGVNYKGLCPFHAEKTPSFVVSEAKRIYHCFGCAKGGNVFTFLMEHAGLSFMEAVQKLANELGILLPKTHSSAAYSDDRQEKRQKKELFYRINKDALLFFKQELKENKNALGFLKKRGVTPQIIEHYHLGYAPCDWKKLFLFLKHKKISYEDLLSLGLIIYNERIHSYYDRFRDRIIFPLFDLSKRVIGFGGRGLTQAIIPKYLNSSESFVYHKSEGLYGLSHAIQMIHQKGVIIVEGYFDCLILHQAGFKNTVATMGTALTAEHVRVLKRFTDQFFVFFDGDEAGHQATERSLRLFLEEGISPRMIGLPMNAEIKDPDDFIQKQGKEALESKIQEARPLIDFVMERIIGRCKHLSGYKTKVISEMAPFLKKYPSSIEREEIIRKLADQLQVEEKWIFKPLNQEMSKPASASSHWEEQIHEQNLILDIEVIEFLMLFPEWLGEALSEKTLDLCMGLEVKDLISKMSDQYHHKQTVDFSALLEKINSSSLKERLLKGILEKENQNRSMEEWKIIYQKCIQRLHKRNLENQEKQLLSLIREMDKQGDTCNGETEKNRLLDAYQKLVKQKQQYT